MDRKKEIEKESKKLKEIFQVVKPEALKLISGLLDETAFLKVELSFMHEILDETGMMKIHPSDKSRQKSLPVANEYRRTLNIYTLNIKVLNSILNHFGGDEEDEFDKWQKENLETKERKRQELLSKGV